MPKYSTSNKHTPPPLSTSELHRKVVQQGKKNLLRQRDGTDTRKLITSCAEYEVNPQLEKHFHMTSHPERSLTTSQIVFQKPVMIYQREQEQLEKLNAKNSLSSRRYTDALNYKRTQEDFPGIENPLNEAQKKQQALNQEKLMKNDKNYFQSNHVDLIHNWSKIKNMTDDPDCDQLIQVYRQMLDIIRQFNNEGLPHFQLNILRKKIQVEFLSQG